MKVSNESRTENMKALLKNITAGGLLVLLASCSKGTGDFNTGSPTVEGQSGKFAMVHSSITASNGRVVGIAPAAPVPTPPTPVPVVPGGSMRGLPVPAPAPEPKPAPTPAPTPDPIAEMSDLEILNAIKKNINSQIDSIQKIIDDLQNGVGDYAGKFTGEELTDYIDKLNKEIVALTATLAKLDSDVDYRRQAIAAYKKSAEEMALRIKYEKELSCTEISVLVKADSFKTQFEKDLALKAEQRCKQEIQNQLQTKWLAPYGHLTCEQKYVVLKDPNLVYESAEHKAFLASLVYHCQWQEFYAKYATKSCDEIKTILSGNLVSDPAELSVLNSLNQGCSKTQ